MPGQVRCLWQNRDATGRRIQFKEYGTYKLSDWSMSGKSGASSFYNHQCCGAHATLIGPSFRLNLWTSGNIPRSMNDRATCVKSVANGQHIRLGQARREMLEKHARHQLAARTDADLLEHGLQMVLHRPW